MPRGAEAVVYKDYAQLEQDFADKKVHPGDFKVAVVAALNQVGLDLFCCSRRPRDYKMVLKLPVVLFQCVFSFPPHFFWCICHLYHVSHRSPEQLLEPIRQYFQTAEMQALIQQAYGSEEGPVKKGASKAAKDTGAKSGRAESAVANAAIDVSRIDIRVGRIVQIGKHPDADSLYVEQIDVGEATPRTVVSGLVGKIPMEDLDGKLVTVVCNLKPANMRGVQSAGMLMAATRFILLNLSAVGRVAHLYLSAAFLATFTPRIQS